MAERVLSPDGAKGSIEGNTINQQKDILKNKNVLVPRLRDVRPFVYINPIINKKYEIKPKNQQNKEQKIEVFNPMISPIIMEYIKKNNIDNVNKIYEMDNCFTNKNITKIYEIDINSENYGIMNNNYNIKFKEGYKNVIDIQLKEYYIPYNNNNINSLQNKFIVKNNN